MATDLVGSIVGGKFLVGQNFGGGAFGQIFMGMYLFDAVCLILL